MPDTTQMENSLFGGGSRPSTGMETNDGTVGDVAGPDRRSRGQFVLPPDERKR